MFKRFLQAAIITFALNFLAHTGPTTTTGPSAVSPVQEAPSRVLIGWR